MANVLFDALVGEKADSEAILFELPAGPGVTYAAFAAMSGRFAKALDAAGVSPGDRVLVQVDKSVEALAVSIACLHRGAVLVPLNTSYEPAEIAYFLGDAEPALLICASGKEATLAPLAEAVGAACRTLAADGTGSLAEASDQASDGLLPVDRTGSDLAAILYTSGTTGRSKGAMLSHDNLLSNALTLTQAWSITDQDVLIHALPIFHTHGLFVAVNTLLLAGGRMILQPSFDIDAVIDALPRATMLMGVPTFYTRLAADDRVTPQAVAGMRLFISGSAPLLPETHEAFHARTGHRILERYGMTETNMNTSNPYDGARIAGTVGMPLPGVELRLTEPGTSREVQAGEVGMIEVRGSNVFSGYWRNPAKTAEELRPDGFFITGDLGRLDDRGYLRIVGREKDLIISGGYNIYPREIEELLDDLPGVEESAVIGMPHGDLGEVPFAVIVPARGAQVDVGPLLAELRGRLAKFKCPRDGAVIDSLPRNAMGKVQKKALREMFATDTARS